MASLDTAARPYAKAVYQCAVGQDNAGDWAQNLADLVELLEDPQVAPWFRDCPAPEFTEFAVAALGIPMASDFASFARLLAENRRLPLTRSIMNLFAENQARAAGKVKIEISTAYALDREQSECLINALRRRTKLQVDLDCIVDEGLLGGVVAKIGDTVIDGSLKARLEKLRLAVMG